MRRALGGWFVIVDREIEIVEVFGEQALVRNALQQHRTFVAGKDDFRTRHSPPIKRPGSAIAKYHHDPVFVLRLLGWNIRQRRASSVQTSRRR